MVDEPLNEKGSINTLGNKKKILNTKAITSIYYSFLHSYLTYGNIACCSTTVSKLKKNFSK